jgi:hypothetical protein
MGRVEQVTYHSAGWRCAADLDLPDVTDDVRVPVRSSTKDLSAVANSLPGRTLRGEISLVSTAAHHSRGAMSGFLRLFDLIPAGHRAMVLRTYDTAGGLRAA